MPSRRSLLLTAAALIASGVATVVPSTPASAASFTFTVVSPVPGHIGVDGHYAGGGGGNYDVTTCSLTGEPTLGWNSSGQLVGTKSVPSSWPGLGSLTRIRYEMYPGSPCGVYDPWGVDVGGVHFESFPGAFNLGEIRMPVLGQNGAFRIDGDILSSTPITPGRVAVDAFQIPSGFPDPAAPLQSNGIVEYGTFSSVGNQGSRWTAGVGWGGLYNLFVRDEVTGRNIQAITRIYPDSIPTIDLDAVCFGFDTCTQSAGSPPPVPGTFYPTTPTRILDTRTGLGILGGWIGTGDGRNSDPNPIARRAVAAKHELKVTGRSGIPDSGVSAVLLNVTAVEAPGPGYLSITPKPARVGNIFDDQAGFGALPGTSNLNVSDGNAVPNMVLARVGAGGKIRITNSFGPTHVIADVAGWFGTAGRHDDGAGFQGVVPDRLMDSRLGVGGPERRFAAGETRHLKVAGVAGVPDDAESVVLNITSVFPDRNGSYITAFPKGEPTPNASNVNGATFGVRANLAVVKVGDDGMISVRTSVSGAHVIVDVMGSFGQYGGAVTAVPPNRSIDTRMGTGTEQRPLGPGESRTLPIRGRAGVPSNATAVIVNITATNASTGGYLTAFPSGAARPTVSNLNFGPGQNVPNLAMLKLGTDGSIEVFNERGSTDVIIDVMGYVS